MLLLEALNDILPSLHYGLLLLGQKSSGKHVLIGSLNELLPEDTASFLFVDVQPDCLDEEEVADDPLGLLWSFGCLVQPVAKNILILLESLAKRDSKSLL